MADRAVTHSVALEWQQFLTMVVSVLFFFLKKETYLYFICFWQKKANEQEKNSDYGKVGPEACRKAAALGRGLQRKL